MRVLKLVPVVMLFVLLGGQPLVSEEAYGGGPKCCGCSTCWLGGCRCPGTYPCPGYCRDNPDTLQAYIPVSIESLNIRAVYNLDVTNSLPHLAKVENCTRRDFASRILGDARESLKVQAFDLGEKGQYDDFEAVRVAVNSEQ